MRAAEGRAGIPVDSARVNRFGKTAFGIAILAWASLSCRPSETKKPQKALLPVIPPAVRFRPPSDGLLTDALLDRYARVRRAARGRSDQEAARAVGVDPEEFAWVRARVVEALVYLETSQVRTAADGTYARTIASLKEAARGARDRETLRKLEEQIAALEKERTSLKSADSPPPSVAGNARRIAPRRAELEP